MGTTLELVLCQTDIDIDIGITSRGRTRMGGGGSSGWVETSTHTMLNQIELDKMVILNLNIGNQMITKNSNILVTEII